MSENEELQILRKQINWRFHGEYAGNFLGKISYKIQQGKTISDMDLRQLRKLILRQTDGKY